MEDWEREHIRRCLENPYEDWNTAHVGTINRICPKLFLLAKTRYQEAQGITLRTLEKKVPAPSAAPPPTVQRLMQVTPLPPFPPGSGNFERVATDSWGRLLLSNERTTGIMFNRSEQLLEADREAIDFIFSSSGAPISRYVRENWQDNTKVTTEVWLGALASAFHGNSTFSASPIDNWIREETATPLQLDWSNPTQTAFQVARMLTNLRTNHAGVAEVKHSEADLQRLLKNTADVTRHEKGGPNVKQTLRNFFKQKKGREAAIRRYYQTATDQTHGTDWGG